MVRRAAAREKFEEKFSLPQMYPVMLRIKGAQ
jgi:hypothetical protein